MKIITENDIHRQINWATNTFGPTTTVERIVKHIRKELVELEECKGSDIKEWVDVIILALHGACAVAMATPADLIQAYIDKMEENYRRQWPDWRAANPNEPIEHIR